MPGADRGSGPLADMRRIVCGSAVLGVAACLAAACGSDRRSETGNAAPGAEGGPVSTGAVTLSGMFSYMADAALFVDCGTGARYPVAMAADYISLERAYLGAEHGPGEPVLVAIQGRVEARPRMEGEGTQETVVVDRFLEIVPGERCPPRSGSAELENTTWILVQLRGEVVALQEGPDTPHIVLQPEGNRLSGSTGCNRMLGDYSVDGGALRFGQIATTLKMCAESAELEAEFLEVLAAATHAEVQDSTLRLLAGDEELARFQAGSTE